MTTLRLFTDGAARRNPGHAGIGVVIEDDKGARLLETCDYIGVATNNEAEYHALIEGLKAAQSMNPERLEVHLDSELVVRQMNGQYKVREPGLKLLHEQAIKMRDSLSGVVLIRHVGREQNGVADALANRAIDEHLDTASRHAAMSSERSDWTMHHFSLANPKGKGQDDVAALLYAVAQTIRSYGEIHVHDITFHDELDDQGQRWPTMTVYYEREGEA